MSPAPRLLDQVREAARVRHLSYRTEQAYVYWARDFIRFQGLGGILRSARGSRDGRLRLVGIRFRIDVVGDDIRPDHRRHDRRNDFQKVFAEQLLDHLNSPRDVACGNFWAD